MNRFKIMYFSLALPDLLKDKRLKKSDAKIGGAAVQWYSWLKGFTLIGKKVGILTYKGAKDYIGGVPEFEIVESFYRDKGIPKLRILYYIIPSLIKTLKKNKTEYLFCPAGSVYTGYLGIAAKFLPTKYVVRIASDADVDERIKTILNNTKFDIFFSNLGLKLADVVLAQNTYQKDILKKRYPKKKIEIVHNPFYTTEQKTSLREKENYIAWVGNFRPVKNLPALLKIVKELSYVDFKIAGAEFENIDIETRKVIEELKKFSNVEFVGYLKREELIKFIRHAKTLLNTSLLEGFSNTFLEAWSNGTPVISTTNVNPDEIITKYNLGFVAKTYDELPGLVKKLFNMDNESYLSLSKNCVQYVSKYHNPLNLALKVIDILENN